MNEYPTGNLTYLGGKYSVLLMIPLADISISSIPFGATTVHATVVTDKAKDDLWVAYNLDQAGSLTADDGSNSGLHLGSVIAFGIEVERNLADWDGPLVTTVQMQVINR